MAQDLSRRLSAKPRGTSFSENKLCTKKNIFRAVLLVLGLLLSWRRVSLLFSSNEMLDMLQQQTEPAMPPPSPRWQVVVSNFTQRREPHTQCALENHEKLLQMHGIQLEARFPSPESLRAFGNIEWNSTEGSKLRIPIYNTANQNVTSDWHVNLWARLVTDHLILTTTYIHYYYPNPKPDDPSLFAELEFVIWESGVYQLEVDLRYLYAGTTNTSLTQPQFTRFQEHAEQVYNQYQPHKPLQFNSPNVMEDVFLKGNQRHQEISVQYMARENDLKAWSLQNPKASQIVFTHWKPYRQKWVDQHCMAIVGSPYQLKLGIQLVDDEGERAAIHNITNSTPSASTTTASSTRFCAASDTLRPGYWRVHNGQRQDRPFLLNASSYYHQWERQHKGRYNLRYYTPGCHWESPVNATRLKTCLAPYNQRINMVGDSLIRLIHKALESYLQVHNIRGVTIGKAFKKRGVDRNGNNDVSAFELEDGGIFIDDFNLIHQVGSSPGRLAMELRRVKAYLDQEQQNLKNTTNPHKKAKFLYYVTPYLNDWRIRQGFEPFVSFYSAMAAEFLAKEAGYEVFDTNRVMRPLVEATGDGLHYHADVHSMVAVMLLNSICD